MNIYLVTPGNPEFLLTAARLVHAVAHPGNGLAETDGSRGAVTLALTHKHLYEYMPDTSARLESIVQT